MKRFTLHLSRFLALMAFSAMAAACADYSELVKEIEEDRQSAHLLLHLTLGSDGISSRVAKAPTPTGGEEGDGHRIGVYHENDINDLCIFRFTPDADTKTAALAAGTLKERGICLINSLASTPVEKVAYLPQVNFTPSSLGASTLTGDIIHYEIPLKIKTKSDGTVFKPAPLGDLEYYVVVANMGDVDATTLGQLRDLPVHFAWRKGTGSDHFADYHTFAMSNEGASQWDGTGDGTEATPYIFTINIERVAARLEFCYKTGEGSPATMPATSTVDPDQPVIQYTAADTPKGGSKTNVGTVYLTHVRPFNVMKQPTSLLKLLAPTNAEGTLYDAAAATYLADELAYKTALSLGTAPLYVVDPKFNYKNTTNDDVLNAYYGDSRWSNAGSGWWFADSYRVHTHTIGEDGFTTGYTDDTDDPNTHFYVLDYAGENTMPAKHAHSNNVTGYMLKAVYVPEKVYDTEANALADSPVTSFAPGTTFHRFVPAATHYDETQAVCFTSKTEADNYAAHALEAGEVQTYTNGICYYPIYLRHDNPGDHPSGEPTPMEFGIVRNNIYRVKVNFSGPGFTTPSAKGEPLTVHPYIFTRPWYQVVHEEIKI